MLSDKLNTALSDFIEEAEKQEKLLKTKDEIIQNIVKMCETALREPEQSNHILTTLIEDYKESI